MGLRRIFVALSLLVLGLFLSVVCAAETGPAPVSTLDLHAYVAELDRLSLTIKSLDPKKPDISELLKQIPTVWQVQTDKQKFEVSSEWLRSDLIELRDDPDKAAQDLILERLGDLRSEALTLETPPAETSEKRAQLNRILAAREFDDIHASSWLGRLKERIQQYLIHLLGRAFGSSVIPTLGNVAVYGLIIVAVLLLAYWMYRSIRKSGELESILPYPLPVSSKEWTLWMAEARASAERGNWRDAIHLGYWCGVSFLEAQGLWRPDYARTPREYLRLLPSSSEHHSTLVALTRSFEVVWYGKQEANEDAFSQTLAQLEKLGCH
jgi:Domain of unknown function (DUF4129)